MSMSFFGTNVDEDDEDMSLVLPDKLYHGIPLKDICTNKATICLGIYPSSELYKTFFSVCKNTQTHLISIGSAFGGFELWIEREFNVKVICVDPTPCSWRQKLGRVVYKPPDHAFIEEVDESVRNNCFLIFNWCFPCDEKTVSNEFNYDFSCLEAGQA